MSFTGQAAAETHWNENIEPMLLQFREQSQRPKIRITADQCYERTGQGGKEQLRLRCIFCCKSFPLTVRLGCTFTDN